MTTNYTQDFLTFFFQILRERNIRFAVLHGYAQLPQYTPSDVDIVIEDTARQQADQLVAKAASLVGLQIIQKLHYDVPYCFYYVIGGPQLLGRDNIRIDLLMDHEGINRYYLNSEELLKDRIPYKGFYIPSYGIQAVYLLIKKSLKGQMSGHEFENLCELFEHHKESALTWCRSYFGIFLTDSIITCVNKRDKHQLALLFPSISGKMAERKKTPLKKWYFQMKRVCGRLRHPSGMFVALFSPDGGGKSSVGKETMDLLDLYFRRKKMFHLKPGWLPQISRLFGKKNDHTIPHGSHSEKRGRLSSLVRWGYYLIDYTLGYFVRVFPLRFMTTLIIMDRYYYDVLVDPVRYGYNLPEKWMRRVIPFIPKPDLCIYLDNSPETIYERKKELPVEEITRQVNAWRNQIGCLPNPVAISTDRPVEEVARSVSEKILAIRAKKTGKHLQGGSPLENFIFGNTSYILLPTRKNARWMFPLVPELSRSSWNLYLPYSFGGSAYKQIVKQSMATALGTKVLKKFPNTVNGSVPTDVSKKLKEIVTHIFKTHDVLVSASAGTRNAFQKQTLMIMNTSGTVLGIIKIGETALSNKRIDHEASVLSQIHTDGVFNDVPELKMPKLLFHDSIYHRRLILLTVPSFQTVQGDNKMTGAHIHILKRFVQKTQKKELFENTAFFKNLHKKIDSYPITFRDFFKDAFHLLYQHAGNHHMALSLSHGDFAPWNMMWGRDNTMFLFDWESSQMAAPLGMDLIHFFYQTQYLLHKKRGSALLGDIRKMTGNILPELFPEKGGMPTLLADHTLLLYLLHMAVSEDRYDLFSMAAVQRRQFIHQLTDELKN